MGFPLGEPGGRRLAQAQRFCRRAGVSAVAAIAVCVAAVRQGSQAHAVKTGPDSLLPLPQELRQPIRFRSAKRSFLGPFDDLTHLGGRNIFRRPGQNQPLGFGRAAHKAAAQTGFHNLFKFRLRHL